MRKAIWALAIIAFIVALDLTLANSPGPVPTGASISSVESSPSFQQVVGNGTYHYSGYSDNPSYSLRCVSSLSSQLHFLDPFHEYTSTTLMFTVQPNITHPAQYPKPANDLPFTVLAEVDPGSGRVLNLRAYGTCAYIPLPLNS